MNSLDSKPWLRAYADGVPDEIEPVNQTLVDMIDEAVAKYGRDVALEFFGAETTYDELGEQIARAAEGLRRLGVKAGDRVTLFGTGQSGEPTAQDWAQATGTISYEILTGIGSRVPRVYIGG